MITVEGKQIETDAFGYLLNIADWNEDVARHIAQLEGVELTEAHWEVILCVIFTKNITPPLQFGC